jgi:hypothetical protein
MKLCFILGWKYLLLSSKDESIKFLAKKQSSDWKSRGSGWCDRHYVYLSKFTQIGTFLIRLATTGPFSAYLHHLAELPFFNISNSGKLPTPNPEFWHLYPRRVWVMFRLPKNIVYRKCPIYIIQKYFYEKNVGIVPTRHVGKIQPRPCMRRQLTILLMTC